MAHLFSHFLGTCVSLGDAEALTEMEDHSIDITYRTFVSHIGAANLRALERRLGYVRTGLALKKDPYVTFYRSKYKGVRVYGLDWSRIDHLFIRPEDIGRLLEDT